MSRMSPVYSLSPESVALLVIDMTNDFLDEGSPAEIPLGRDIVDPIRSLIDTCHEVGAPVIFTSHVLRPDGSDVGRMADMAIPLVDDRGKPVALAPGSRGVQITDALAPQEGDIVLEKHRSSAFFERELDTVLRGLGVSTVIITGMATNGCCYATALDAGFRGYRVVFVADATATTGVPDAGYGAFSADESQRMTLTIVQFAVGEVASSGSVVERLRAT
jgi:ureidoacrylate peracid hydrolase